jgi:uncharacterized protein
MESGNAMSDINAINSNDVAPAISGERISSLDFIRGLAVMGILAANIIAFGQPFTAYMYPKEFLVPDGDPGGWLWVAQFVLVDGKMRGLFTLLFGAGLMLFMEKAWARGSTRWLQARRLMWLLLFGLSHFYFIWRGDILTYYAIVGLIVLLCLKWSISTQFRVGLFGYIIGALLYAAMMGPLHFVGETDFGNQPQYSEMRAGLEQGKADALAEETIDTQLRQGGDYLAILSHRIEAHGTEPLTNLTLFIFETFPLILLGTALYRMGLFSGGMDPEWQRFWGWMGLAIGAFLHLMIALWAKGTGFAYYATLGAFMGFSPIPRLIMVLGLAALLAQYAPRATGWLGQRISAAGRAAFTNYLGTSIVMTMLFHGWALGFFGEFNRPQLYLVVLATWALMLLWSKPWLEHYRFGPLEWLWRCLTYGKLFALKR